MDDTMLWLMAAFMLFVFVVPLVAYLIYRDFIEGR